MSAPGKEKDKEKLMTTKLAELLDVDITDKDSDSYVDLTITCVNKDKPSDILEGVPTLRVILK